MFCAEDTMARRHHERQFIDEGLSVWRQKKEMDAAREIEEKRQLRHMLKTYNPWGKPGHGAPMPGAVRKTKLILDQPDIAIDEPTSVLTMGRPGHGAPLRTSSGRTKTTLSCDPNIRFQFQEPARRSVDNDLRYKMSPEEKENYKKQLDAIISQKQPNKRTYKQPSSGLERAKQLAHSPWGRPGPGGRIWRSPRLQGFNFLKSLGWSNEVTLRRQAKAETEEVFKISGGVELVPLLAKHRGTPRRPLPTTDITRISRLQNGPPKTSESEAIYHHELSNQVSQRQQKIKEAQKEDQESNRRHFDTWKGLWGRPGHGAPKGRNLAKEKLEVILYHVPARRLSAV